MEPRPSRELSGLYSDIEDGHAQDELVRPGYEAVHPHA